MVNIPHELYTALLLAETFRPAAFNEREAFAWLPFHAGSAGESMGEGARIWVHLDLMAWNLSARPGRPAGGEAMGLRSLYALVKKYAENKAE